MRARASLQKDAYVVSAHLDSPPFEIGLYCWDRARMAHNSDGTAYSFNLARFVEKIAL